MPAAWSAVVYDDDGEDERDDLLEALNANSLPTLLVFDPISGKLLEQNAVHAVQAGGSGDNFVALLNKWRSMIASGDVAGSTAAAAATVQDEKKQCDDPEVPNELHYFVPAPPALICEYFQQQLLSPNLHEALEKVIVKREALEGDEAVDDATTELADSMLGDDTTSTAAAS
ncbi:MAG: hypothetical protein SGARI_005504, partial [Bacillariaceae sp.]